MIFDKNVVWSSEIKSNHNNLGHKQTKPAIYEKDDDTNSAMNYHSFINRSNIVLVIWIILTVITEMMDVTSEDITRGRY